MTGSGEPHQTVRTVRAWLAGVAAAALLAGVAIGLALPRLGEWLAADAAAAQDDANAELVRRYTERYGLDEAQARLLRMVLASSTVEESLVLRQHIDRYPDDVRDQVANVKRRADERVEALLDDRQRELYWQDRQPPRSEADGGREPGGGR